ncbi:MAG: hypothetical protein JW761_13920 [Prolixibacteraceae bacterium]|nr:hypothetical protein [Prolixibacteraceae bacterium]
MGIERDYLMRQLLMLFEVIHKILRLRKKGEEEEAKKEINYFYECLKIGDDIQNLSIEKFIDVLVSEKQLTNEHLEMIAFVMKEQGELAKTEKERLQYFHKAYFLLRKVEQESTSFSMDRQMKMAELEEYLPSGKND